MAWIFQGNPNRFDIDDYLSRYPQLIYWRTNRYVKDIVVGDPVFVWRAGNEAGAVAVGKVVEEPTPAHAVKHPEALGDDLWVASEASSSEFKTGIQLSEIRLSADDDMVSRATAKDDTVLAASTIITVPTGTVFRFSDNELSALERLWGTPVAAVQTDGANEGKRQLRAHYARERSSRLRRDKLSAFRKEHGRLCCEICDFSASAHHPDPFTERAYEVHHKNPLSAAAAPVRTTLQDLAVLCANCHRAVHANSHVTENYEELAKLYACRK
ncbi:EVE domain-containing protein [Vreelandella titanicae]|uniref:EVE domain-containing protein n=1 Tax=Halomonadaceae TaxID=28256 RepID=UPI0004891DCF|nr:MULTISPECIES: EVE domain-containing protein [unclassified Halomonas]NAO96039.1 EVE domain-containing protein [Halomonas sp. MG34]PKH60257.1 EVE domain-containing protein [Halomonas sp. Choline-3u-9]QGQ69399.1 EVE domain-containing protein [Halomonas sp. PA16-9]